MGNRPVFLREEQSETREVKCFDNDSQLLPALRSQKAVAPGGLPGISQRQAGACVCRAGHVP